MSEDLRNLVLGVVAAGVGATLGWLTRAYLWRRRLRRKQSFFGLPGGTACLLVVHQGAGDDGAVHRFDVSALLELAALVKDCGAQAEVVRHDLARQGFGDRTEFCLGGPSSNQRMAAHLRSLLPGVAMDAGTDPKRRDRGSLVIGSESYPPEKGMTEYVVLARLPGGEGGRPVFLFCGQHPITHQAATRYLSRHYEKLARKYGGGPSSCS